jgi:hypothetical protein
MVTCFGLDEVSQHFSAHGMKHVLDIVDCGTQRSLSVIKHSLLGRGFIAVVPSRFRFTTIDLTNLRRVAMPLTDFLLISQSITSPHSKSLSSSDLPILLVLLSNEQHAAFCFLLDP